MNDLMPSHLFGPKHPEIVKFFEQHHHPKPLRYQRLVQFPVAQPLYQLQPPMYGKRLHRTLQAKYHSALPKVLKLFLADQKPLLLINLQPVRKQIVLRPLLAETPEMAILRTGRLYQCLGDHRRLLLHSIYRILPKCPPQAGLEHFPWGLVLLRLGLARLDMAPLDLKMLLDLQ